MAVIEDEKWFVVHTYSGYENKVATTINQLAENRNMQDQIIDVRVPTETVTEVETRSSDEAVAAIEEAEAKTRPPKAPRTVERKLYPGYVFVKVGVVYDEKERELKMTDEAWYLIRNTRGVTGFVGPGSKPIPLTDAEVFEMGVEKRVVEVSYSVGDHVEITSGIMQGYTGVVKKIDLETETVSVLIDIFGRSTLTELELDEIEVVQ